MEKKLYPIKFIADPRERIWGGDYLSKKLGKEFDEEYLSKRIGESWELWSLFGGSSVAANGYLAGNTLDEIMEIYLADLTGDPVFHYFKGDFPVMVKILDIEDKISVQVHPDDATALEREESYGKAELWYIMDVRPGAKIYVGFNKDVTPAELYERCKNGTVTEILNCYTPQKGDFIYIKPGCIHSASGGVVITEIQESSDATYRLYDWGRENDPKTARRMDLEDAIDIIDYAEFDEGKYYFPQVKGTQKIVDTANYIVNRLQLKKKLRIDPMAYNSFIIYVCEEGEASLTLNDGSSYRIAKGETILVPAGMEDFDLAPETENAMVLEIYMPELAEEPDSYLNYDEPEDDAHGSYNDMGEDEAEKDKASDDAKTADDEVDLSRMGAMRHPGEFFFRNSK